MSDMKFILEGLPERKGNLDISFSEQLFRNLKLGGNNIIQIDNATGNKVSYWDILRKSVNLAEALRRLGVKKGDVIGMSSENRFEFTVSVVAVLLIGAVNAPINVLYTKNEILHAMKISKPKMMFCSPLTVRNIRNAIRGMKSAPKIIEFGDKKTDPAFLSYEDLINEHTDVQTFKLAEVDFKKHPAAILCSSGTTGLAKGVVVSHYNLSICTNHLRHLMDSIGEESSCLLTLLPWFHAYGFVTHLSCINLQLRSVIQVKFEERSFLSAIQNHKVSVTFVVPPLMVFLAKHPLVSKFDLTSLKEIWCGAAPLSKEMQVAVAERIGVSNIKQGYGLTETTLAVLHNGNGSIKYGSCGQVVPGTKAKVIDVKSGKSLGPYKEGELCFKGPLMMQGYIGDAESTNQIFDSEGWLHSGDIGYYDDDKFFYIIDRLKELIKYNGFQVPPAELEALILQHPEVKDVGVIGKPDETAGELPMAFVVREVGAKITEEDIISFVASRISTHKQLRGGVNFLEEVPKNPSGKILRRELRDLLKKLPKSKL